MHTDSEQLLVEVDKDQIAYLVGLFEAYGDFAVVRTLDPGRGLVELLCSPDYLPDIRALLEDLKKEINVRTFPGSAR
ncbi:MAG: DUF4911 domain-containing protein [Nitrospinae bacterium]|nr:DUF4911 domain-containing protein [Nitrospinota bacterium]